MDPNETLSRIRTYRHKVLMTEMPMADRAALATMLAEAIADLDSWLSRGGRWPDGWNQNGGATCGRCVAPGLDVDEFRAALAVANKARCGDSNDEEIDALWDTVDIVRVALGIEDPETGDHA